MVNQTEKKGGAAGNILASLVAGAVASFITQPLEVIKTNKINTGALYRDIHRNIIDKGWRGYMRGASLAVIKQAYGFTIYINLLDLSRKYVDSNYPNLNKYFNYSVSAASSKFIAMFLEAPLTLLKTRREWLGSESLTHEVKKLRSSPLKDYTNGFGATASRELAYTLFHYNTYRYLKDEAIPSIFGFQSTFMAAFMAGIIATTASQPFEVLRNQMSIQHPQPPLLTLIVDHYKKFGFRAYFAGFLPRVTRKPINSGVCWTLMDILKTKESDAL